MLLGLMDEALLRYFVRRKGSEGFVRLARTFASSLEPSCKSDPAMRLTGLDVRKSA